MRAEIFLFRQTVWEYITCPLLFIYVTPHFYGDSGLANVLDIIDDFKKANKSKFLETVEVNGTHQFHMIEAEKAANIVLDFLKKALNENKNIKITSKI